MYTLAILNLIATNLLEVSGCVSHCRTRDSCKKNCCDLSIPGGISPVTVNGNFNENKLLEFFDITFVQGSSYIPGSDELADQTDLTNLLNFFEPTIPSTCQTILYAAIDPDAMAQIPYDATLVHAIVLKAKPTDLRIKENQLAYLFSIFANVNVPDAEFGGNANSAMFILPAGFSLVDVFFTIFCNYNLQEIFSADASPPQVPPVAPTAINVRAYSDAFCGVFNGVMPVTVPDGSIIKFYNYSLPYGIVHTQLQCFYDRLKHARHCQCKVPESVINTIGNIICIERMREGLFRRCCVVPEESKCCSMGERLKRYACAAASCISVCSTPELVSCIEPCMKNCIVENSFNLFLAINMVIGNSTSHAGKCMCSNEIQTVYGGYFDFSFVANITAQDLQGTYGLTDLQVDFMGRVSVGLGTDMSGELILMDSDVDMVCSDEESSSTERKKKKRIAAKARGEDKDEESFVSRNKWPIAVGVVAVTVVVGISVYLVAM